MGTNHGIGSGRLIEARPIQPIDSSSLNFLNIRSSEIRLFSGTLKQGGIALLSKQNQFDPKGQDDDVREWKAVREGTEKQRDLGNLPESGAGGTRSLGRSW